MLVVVPLVENYSDTYHAIVLSLLCYYIPIIYFCSHLCIMVSSSIMKKQHYTVPKRV